MNYYSHQNQKGYSVIELVVYLAIFIALSVVVIESLVSSMRTLAVAQAYRRLQSNGELITERIVREVRDATSVAASGNVFDANPGSFSLSGTDENGATTAVSFSVVNGAVQINDNGTTGTLSTSEVTINSLIFRHIVTAKGEGIKTELILSTASGYATSASFYSTAMVRGK